MNEQFFDKVAYVKEVKQLGKENVSYFLKSLKKLVGIENVSRKETIFIIVISEHLHILSKAP